MATSVIGNLSAILSLNASQFHSGMDKASKRMGKFRKNMNTMGRSLALPMTIAGGAMIKAASDIEKGMIGVQKTTGLADGEIKKLRDSLLDFSTQNNVTISSLLETAKVAGQMGIQGQDAISKFTQAFAKLEVASDRTVAGEAGAQAFSKFLDLSGEGIAAAEAVASAMVELGNTSKTTEGKILETATEIVKKTNRFKLGAANILGLATALDEAGVKSEVAGSTMQKFFESVNEAVIVGGDPLAEFARLTGRSAEELKKLIQTNPAQILLEFSAGLKQANTDGENTVGILKMLGLGGIRAASTMNVLAERHVQLADKMGAANDAQRQNIALQAEADAANRGTAAAMQKLINSLQKMATSRFFEQILAGFTGLVEILTVVVDWLGNKAMPAITLFVSDVITAVMEMKDKAVKIVGDMIEAIQEWFTRPLGKIVDKTKEAVDGVLDWFRFGADEAVGNSIIPDMVRDIGIEMDQLPGIMGDPAEEASRGVLGHFETMRDGISTLLNDILTGSKSFGDSLVGIFQSIGSNLLGKGIDAVSGAITEGIAAKVSGSGSFTGAAGKALLGGASKLFGGASTVSGAGGSAAGISGASVTGGSSGAGLGGSAAGLGPAASVAAAAAVLFAQREIISAIRGASSRDKALKDLQRAGPGVAGGLGLQATAGDKFGFGLGANAGFAADFGKRQLGAKNAGTMGEGTAVFAGLGLEETIKLLDEAQSEFERLKSTARSTLQLGQKESVKVGQALQDGVIDQTELAELGFTALGEKITNTKSGVVKMGDVSVEQFDKIMQAVNNGIFRLEALRGETQLNQREMQFLGDAGLTAAEGLRALGREGAAALGQIEGAANRAAGAISNVGGARRDPNVGPSEDDVIREINTVQQLRDNATRR